MKRPNPSPAGQENRERWLKEARKQLRSGRAPKEIVEDLCRDHEASRYFARITVANALRESSAQDPDDRHHWITPSQAAQLFGGSASNIRWACRMGRIPGARPEGKRWLFTVAAFREWQLRGKHDKGRKD